MSHRAQLETYFSLQVLTHPPPLALGALGNQRWLLWLLTGPPGPIPYTSLYGSPESHF